MNDSSQVKNDESFKLYEFSKTTDERNDISILMKKEIIGRELECVHCTLFFKSPHNKLVISIEQRVCFYDSNTFKLLSELTDAHKSDIYDLERWDSTKILSGSEDNTVCCISIISPHKIIKKFDGMPSDVYRVLKLNEDKFVTYVDPQQFYILNYHTGKIEKNFELGCLYDTQNMLVLSKNFENCFYTCINTEKDEQILLVNYEEDTVHKEFKKHDKDKVVIAIALFHSTRNEEILVACCSAERIFLYNTSKEEYTINKKFTDFSFDWLETNNDEFSHTSYSCYSFNNQFLVTGGVDGRICIFEYFPREDMVISKTCGCGILKDWVCFSELYLLEKNSFQFISCCFDGRVVLVEVKGVDVQSRIDSFEFQDLTERILYLREESEEILVGLDNSKFCISVKLSNLEIHNVCKNLLIE